MSQLLLQMHCGLERSGGGGWSGIDVIDAGEQIPVTLLRVVDGEHPRADGDAD